MKCIRCLKEIYDRNIVCAECHNELWKSGNVPEANRNAVLADVGERLLPCPLCGIPAAIEKAHNYMGWTIWCVSCGVEIYDINKEDVIGKWNKRANVS